MMKHAMRQRTDVPKNRPIQLRLNWTYSYLLYFHAIQPASCKIMFTRWVIYLMPLGLLHSLDIIYAITFS